MASRRIVSVVLAALMGAVLIAAPAHAAFVFVTIDGITYRADDANVAGGAFAWSSTTVTPDLVIPEAVTIGGTEYVVVGIGANAFDGKGLTSVVLPDTIVHLDPYSFARNSLTSVTIPGSVGVVNTGAFAWNNLTSVTISEGVRVLNGGAFFDNALTDVVIPSTVYSVNGMTFSSNPGLTTVTFDGDAPDVTGTTTLGDSAPTVRFYEDSTGFTTPTWTGGGATTYTTQMIPLADVVFNENGHDTAPGGVTVRPETAIADPGDLSATGYAFTGWWTAASGGTQVTFPYLVTGDVTLFAQWDANSHIVTFDSTNGDASTAQAVDYDSAATEPTDPVRTGHTFTGWFTAASGGALYDFDTLISGDLTLYAQWDVNEYTITFEPGNGAGALAVDGDYDTDVSEPTEPGRPDHTFDGWFTAASAGTQVTFPHTIAGDVTFYAQWSEVPTSIDAQSVAAAGESITVTGENFAPYEVLEIWLLSTPVQLATITADADGGFSTLVTIPSNVASGGHTIEVRGITTGNVSRGITITGVLAATGDDISSAAWLALSLFATGAGLLGVARRFGVKIAA